MLSSARPQRAGEAISPVSPASVSTLSRFAFLPRSHNGGLVRTRSRLLALAGAVLLGTAATLTVPGTASAANLVNNSGFESATLSGWSCSGGLGSVVSSPVHSGSKALAGAAGDSDNAKCTQTVAVQPNTTYTLSGWVRGSYVYLGVTGGGSTWTTSTSGYSQLSLSFTTGASQTSADIYLNGWYGQGTYYADDISLDGPGGSTDTQAPTAPSGLQSTGKTSSSAALSWTAATDNVGVTGYDIYQGGTKVSTVTGTSATVSGLAASTTYSFTVKARDAAGNVSAASNAVSVTTSSGGSGGTGFKQAAPYLYLGWGNPCGPEHGDERHRRQVVHHGLHPVLRWLQSGLGRPARADRRCRPVGHRRHPGGRR